MKTILADVILACDAAGLIGQVEAYFDMTGIEASATQVPPASGVLAGHNWGDIF